MTENKRYEAYYDKYMEDWKVQDILTLDILPCVSEKVAKEFANRLNNSYCANKKLLKSNDFLLKEIEQLKEENILLKRKLDDASKLLDGLTIPELLELIKQYEDFNIHFSKIKNIYVDEKGRLIGIDYND